MWGRHEQKATSFGQREGRGALVRAGPERTSATQVRVHGGEALPAEAVNSVGDEGDPIHRPLIESFREREHLPPTGRDETEGRKGDRLVFEKRRTESDSKSNEEIGADSWSLWFYLRSRHQYSYAPTSGQKSD